VTFTPPQSDPSRTRVNAKTALPGQLERWQERLLPCGVSAHEAYRRVVAAEASEFFGPASQAGGYVVYAVMRDGIVRRELPMSGQYLVIGRHTQCDLGFADQDVSNRHVLLRTWTTDDGLPLVALLDLDTNLGFSLADGSKQRAVVASGPLVFRVGLTWLVALPRSETLPPELGMPVVQQSDASSYKVDPHGARLESRAGPCGRLPTFVSIHPSSVHVAQSPRFVLVPESTPADPGFEILLERDGRGAGIRVSERDVGHGILLGRDPRCVDAGLRSILDDGVSRVHALIIRERDGVKLYDTASTHGVFDGTTKRRCIALSDTGTTVILRSMSQVVMRWRART
jgi:hypothetical protein